MRISATSLNRFWTCPKQYEYGKKLKLKDPPWYVKDGVAAHALLAGVEPEYEVTDRAKALARHARRFDDIYDIKAREVKQDVKLTKTITLRRIIDVLAYADDNPTVVDYKFPIKRWAAKVLDRPTHLKSTGVQTSAYLYPPSDPAPFDHWPIIMIYLVCWDENKPIDRIYAAAGLDGSDGLIEMAKHVEWAEKRQKFPKRKGEFNCGWCDFQAICWQIAGWNTMYDKRRDKDDIKE